MSYSNIQYETDGDIAQIVLDRPDKLNSISVPMWTEFTDALNRADNDDEIRSIVLSGAGDAFCAGDNIDDITSLETFDDALEYAHHVLEHSGTVEQIGTPVVAKIDGITYGVGCELAAICDVTVASEDASFCLSEPQIGVSPLNGLFRLPDLIGLKRARELMLTARKVDAREAHKLGIATEVTSPGDLDDAVDRITKQISSNAPMVVEMTKRYLNSRRDGDEEAATVLAYLSMTEDGTEGTQAFLEKREPEWKAQ